MRRKKHTPLEPLPDDMPGLPPGMFYRVWRENVFSIGPLYWLTVREEGRWCSRAVGRDVRIRVDEDTDPAEAVRQAGRAAMADIASRRQQVAVWGRTDRYVGDHGRETSE